MHISKCKIKKIICVVFAAVICFQLIPFSSFAAEGTCYYVDSANGNDGSLGTSPLQAWKTVSNIKSTALNPGDKVLFCRGGEYECDALTFNCCGTEDKPIVISSYGEGDKKPLLFTNKKSEVLVLIDCSYVTVSDFEITAHNGGGIWVDTIEKESDGITLTNLKMHDMQNVNQNSRDTLSRGAATARACIMVKGLPANSRYPVNNLKITDSEMYDTGNGISLWGSWNDEQDPWCDSEKEADPIFNENALVENIYFHDMTAESIIVGICKNALVTNCRSINCCQDEGVDENGQVKFCNASMWFWGSVYCTIDHCEISGQKNAGDGMAVDFDSYSHYCTYQYIYSHDNVRFMNNCAMYDGQKGNSVHHCLSVNDNKNRIRFSMAAGEYGFSFYNNTLVNCGDVCFMNLYNSKVYNNIFMPKFGCSVQSDAKELISYRGNVYRNNCYYNCPTPLVDLTSFNTVPGFAGNDKDNPESFALSENSKLLGKGCDKYDNIAFDFFKNEIQQKNIGCYGGTGVENSTAKSSENFVEYIFRTILDAGAFVVCAIIRLIND